MTVQPIVVLGAGALGTALAHCLARSGRSVVLWGRDAAAVGTMERRRENTRYLPGIELDRALRFASDLNIAASASLLLSAVPAQATRGLLRQVAAIVQAPVPVVTVAKGIELGTLCFMSDVMAACLPEFPLAILSGPSFAADIARGLPTAVTLASTNLAQAKALAQVLATPALRLYHTDDMRGVEIGGAAKNVLAIACGIAAGCGLGASAGAALVARGFAELARFGAAYGAQSQTLMGLSGLGDLVLTCNSPQSRNFALGLALGQGKSLQDIKAQGKLAEGAFTARALIQLAQVKAIDMPICAAVDAVLNEAGDLRTAIHTLLARPPRAEA